MAKQSAKALFQSKAMGDNIPEFSQQLKKKIKQQYQILCHENAKECEVPYLTIHHTTSSNLDPLP